MNPHVRLEVEIKGKPFAAEIALVRFFTCVHQHMSF
jgi:hypothetical protein